MVRVVGSAGHLALNPGPWLGHIQECIYSDWSNSPSKDSVVSRHAVLAEAAPFVDFSHTVIAAKSTTLAESQFMDDRVASWPGAKAAANPRKGVTLAHLLPMTHGPTAFTDLKLGSVTGRGPGTTDAAPENRDHPGDRH